MKRRFTPGQVFCSEHGNIVLLRDVSVEKGRKRKCEFKCFCGNKFEAYPYNVNSEYTKSCGCLKLRNASRNGKRNRLSLTHRKFYRKWYEMTRKNDTYLMWYDFDYFIEDLKRTIGFYPDKVLTRIDKNKPYEPDNVTWK